MWWVFGLSSVDVCACRGGAVGYTGLHVTRGESPLIYSEGWRQITRSGYLLIDSRHLSPMAQSTTATTAYPLIKYSRSYPSGIGQATPGTDWQHFSNPALRLVLDVTKTGNSELRSVRLRVIWTIQNGGVITMNDNSEITLASIGEVTKCLLLNLPNRKT